MKRLWTCLWIGLGLSGCAEYGLAEGELADWGTQMDASDYRRLRIDITPSNASDNILPQSFWIDEEADWQNLDLALEPNTVITGNITGYTIYPYIDVAIPGEEVPVEAQVQINQPNGINGAIINSDESGNFELTVPRGSD